MFRTAITLCAALALGACNLVPEGRTSERPRPPAAAKISSSPQARQCLTRLGNTGSGFTALPDRYLGSGCSQLNTVRLAHVRGDTAQLALANLGPVTCPTANAFAGWARFGVDRAARQILGSPLTRIETMGSYACRNVAGSGRRSAHASADAIDIAAFVLADGRRVSVIGDWSEGSPDERRFLRVVQASACKRFGTVLGPEYNSAHKDHFHLERGGKSEFCR